MQINVGGTFIKRGLAKPKNTFLRCPSLLPPPQFRDLWIYLQLFCSYFPCIVSNLSFTSKLNNCWYWKSSKRRISQFTWYPYSRHLNDSWLDWKVLWLYWNFTLFRENAVKNLLYGYSGVSIYQSSSLFNQSWVCNFIFKKKIKLQIKKMS